MKLVYRSSHGRVIPMLLHDGHDHPTAKDMQEQALAPYLAVYEVDPRYSGFVLSVLTAIYKPPVAS